MVTEPIIGDEEQQTGPVPPTGARARLPFVVGVVLVAVVVWTGLLGGRPAPSQDDALLIPPLVASGPARIRSPIPAEVDDGHLSWQRVPLTDHRLQAAGEVAGRLVLALEDLDGTSRIGFVSPAGLVAGTAVTSPVDQVASWRNRLLLVGADDDGPVLHLQHADGTLRRL
ncbi:MAG TPA: hypothetical protein VMQ46_08395, partial [Acidimicrobiia bacterium]|nr:hypothetical protein [Acidimicrobiia bacterium]